MKTYIIPTAFGEISVRAKNKNMLLNEIGHLVEQGHLEKFEIETPTVEVYQEMANGDRVKIGGLFKSQLFSN